MLTINNAIMKSAEYLRAKGVDSPRLDAELLLAAVMNCDRLRLYMDWQKPLTDLETSGYREYIRRRGQDREPVARILGRKQFHGREFEVSPDTFVPRPETEGLVERALLLLEKDIAPHHARASVFEVGTGTGCIIVTMAAESGAHHYLASDTSAGALATAHANAKRHHVEGRIDFRQGTCFAGYEGALSMIVSNPPYIESAAIAGLAPEVSTFDPRTALDGGPDGLDTVRTIIDKGKHLLLSGGWMLFEIGEKQATPAAELFRGDGLFTDIRAEEDLAGIERYVLARRK